MHRSLADLCRKAEEENRNFWEVVLEDDCRERQLSPEASFAQMRAMYRAMKDADASYDPTLYSRSGLTGRDGGKMQQYVDEHETICGPFLGRVIEKALKMGESNACMKRIVAAPTAGACGVVPAVMLPMQEACGYSDDEMTRALYVAAGIGGVIASRAFISGAQGGCQAEVGSAASMAAGAAVYLRGGDASAIAHSAAMAMKNLLGLVCDPVAGWWKCPVSSAMWPVRWWPCRQRIWRWRVSAARSRRTRSSMPCAAWGRICRSACGKPERRIGGYPCRGADEGLSDAGLKAAVTFCGPVVNRPFYGKILTNPETINYERRRGLTDETDQGRVSDGTGAD